jgi:membrane-bound lytic murein transglycosylase D
VDWWVDERRDPFKATDAAARFLTQLHRQFGSYYLAAAAYNGGPGRVSRGLARYEDKMSDVEGEDRFFALAEESYLRKETRNYVPQLVAAALVGKEPHKYGLKVDSAPPILYDSVLVGPLTSISAVALAANAPLDVIKDLNPAFIRGVTPPGSADSHVRVPVGATENFLVHFSALPDEERVPFVTVAAKKGQTMARIAKAHGLTTSALAAYNRSLSTKKALRTGQPVLVPRQSVLVAARNVPDPAIERYGAVTTTAGGRRTHLVRRGENLGAIARRYRTSVATLRRLNGLRTSTIYAGQRIIVGGTPARRAAAPSKARAKSKAVRAKAPVRKAAPKAKVAKR